MAVSTFTRAAPCPRRGLLRLAGAMAVGLFFPAGWGHAHGDDQLLIDALTEELAKAPEADLFIRRGELFRHHEEWTKAEADFAAAAKLDPQLALVDYFRARLWLEAGAPEKARTFIDRYIASSPRESEAWFLRGDVLAALGQHEAGAAEYAEAIGRATSPRPEHYLRRAKFLQAIPKVEAARILAALDEGIAKVGPVISLVEFAIALELERQDYPAALARINAALERAPRREGWLVRQGDVLVKCGRVSEAIGAYRAALEAIAELPERYRETVPVEKLARDAQDSLSRLSVSNERNANFR